MRFALAHAPRRRRAAVLTFSIALLSMPLLVGQVLAASGIYVANSPSVTQAHVGDTITYTFSLGNLGDGPLHDVQVLDTDCDNSPTYEGGDFDGDGVLDVPETFVFRCTHDVVQADVPMVDNLVTVHAVDAGGSPVSATGVANVEILDPKILVEDNTALITHLGDKANYSYVVTNPGNTPLLQVEIDAPVCDAGTPTGPFGDEEHVGYLDVDEAWQYGCLHLVTTGDGDPVHSTVSVSGIDALGRTVGSTDSSDVALVHPAMSVTKRASRPTARLGDVITYTFNWTNTGDVPFGTTARDDPKCDEGTLTQPVNDVGDDGQIVPGEKWTFSCTHKVVTGDGAHIHNTITVTAMDYAERVMSVTGSADVDIVSGTATSGPTATTGASPSAAASGDGSAAPSAATSASPGPSGASASIPAAASPSPSADAAPAAAGGEGPGLILLVVLGVVIAALAGGAWWYLRRRPGPA